MARHIKNKKHDEKSSINVPNYMKARQKNKLFDT